MKKIISRVAALVVGLGLGTGALAGLESVTHISDLNSSWPLGSDLASTSDDHIRNIKTALKTDFPNINAAVTATPTQLNQLTGLSTAQGDILYASAANTLTNLAKNTTATRYLSNTGASNNPAWAQINLANGVTGNLTSSNLDLTMSPTWTGSHIFSNPVFVGGSSSSGVSPIIGAKAAGTTIISGRDTTNSLEVLLGTASPLGFVGTLTNHEFDIRTNNTARLTIGTGGNAVLNSPTSGIAFSVGGAGSSAATPIASFMSSGGTGGFISQNDGTHESLFGTSSTGGFVGTITNHQFDIRSNNTARISLANDGSFIKGYGPTAATVVDMTPDTGTFTATYTGMTGSVTCTATWSRIGKLVSLFFCAATGTSNAASFTMTGLPSAIQPASLTQTISFPIGPVVNNSLLVSTVSVTVTASSGTITFLNNGSSTGWTSSGSKGLTSGGSISYLIN